MFRMRVMIRVIENLELLIPLRLKLPLRSKSPLKLRLQASIPMCGNLVTMKWTQLISFQPETHGKIKTNCSVGSVDKQIGLDLRLSLEDLVKEEMLCWSWFVNGAASTNYQREK